MLTASQKVIAELILNKVNGSADLQMWFAQARSGKTHLFRRMEAFLATPRQNYTLTAFEKFVKDYQYNTCGHELLSYKLGYGAHQDEMEKRDRAGQKQAKCPHCGLFLYKDELKTNPINVGKMP